MAATYSVDGQSFGSIGEVENYLSDQGYSGKYTIEDNRQGGIGRQTGVSMGEGAGLLGVAGGGGYTSFGDMFDGGGPGRSGPTFVGGPFSAGLNAMGVRPAGYTERMAAAPGPQGQRGFNGYGYTDPKTGQWVSAGRDMIDGGGPGRSGDTFQGGPFSGLLNALGVRPAGYRARQEAAERAGMQMTPADVRTGLLGGTGGTAAAVERAKEAAARGKTSAAPAGQYRLSYSDVRDLARKTGGEYPSAVGDIATADELAFLMGEGRNYFMSDEDLAMATSFPAAPPSPTYGANIGTAEILPLFGGSNRSGYYKPVPGVTSSSLDLFRRAAGTPNASLAAVGPDAALYSYLSKERIRPSIIDTLQQPGYASARQKLQDYFERDNMLPASALEKFR